MKEVQLVSHHERKVSSVLASSGLSSNPGDAWHFEVEGLPSIAVEFRVFIYAVSGPTGN
jgi:hypothetical protein